MIVLVPFPFADNPEDVKPRPALVIGTPSGDNLIFMKISGELRLYGVPLDFKDLISGKMKKQSYITIDMIFTLDKKKIKHYIAEISEEKYTEVIDAFYNLIR